MEAILCCDFKHGLADISILSRAVARQYGCHELFRFDSPTLIMLFRFVNVIDIFKTAPTWFRPSSLWLPNLYDVSHSVETIFTTHFKLPSLCNSWFCKKLLQIKLRTFRNRFRYCPSQILYLKCSILRPSEKKRPPPPTAFSLSRVGMYAGGEDIQLSVYIYTKLSTRFIWFLPLVRIFTTQYHTW
jgi:hypothetical protein